MYTKEKTGQINDGRYIQWNTMQLRKRIQSSLVSKGNTLQETAVRDFPWLSGCDSMLPQGAQGSILGQATRILQNHMELPKKKKETALN